ncbi:uncharacterized protein LOC109711739 isoform X2 [Ananas comosus]|uniref:Uncharacterized protein LOC109711739 isoform X2 n=1 Tax=Ananas comosus TaxID=4615 RepID=A0A6P5F320_ANACO|nr:uncharacterized protein LOC109711739 isoform X2 [Ananas comosus]
MLRLLLRRRRPLRRRFSSQAPQDPSYDPLKEHLPSPPAPPPLLRTPIASPSPASHSDRSFAFYALAGTLASSVAAAAYLSSSSSAADHRIPSSDQIYADLEKTLEASKGSVRRVVDQMRQTGAAAAVLWKSLASVMSSANQEVRSGFELRVAALLADIAAANSARRAAIVGAGGGAVVDWLLDSVAAARGNGAELRGTQAEAARALAHLIADPEVCPAVLGRPHAVPNLLRFIFSFQPKKPKKHFKLSSLDGSDHSKGRSMLVAALMDIVTSNCDNVDYSSFRPLLPGNADMRDIATAIEVVEQGGMHFDDHNGSDDGENGDRGVKGIGIKILGGTTVLGFSQPKDDLEVHTSITTPLTFEEKATSPAKVEKLNSATVPGLWDDLQREYVAVPFAAWALANWALASDTNRSHIQELDSDGNAVMTALAAPERTVKWHGSLVARSLLDDQNLPLIDSVPKWTSCLLSTAFQASKNDDFALARVALSAFLVSVERCKDSKMVVMENGLHFMREIAKQAEKHNYVQEIVARVLSLLYTGGFHLSLEESQKWSGILLRWVFGQSSADTIRPTAVEILSCILDDHGPASIPISQGWLTVMLSEILGSNKASNLKGGAPPKTDSVKSEIDKSNAYSATQVANQLATAVVRLAMPKLEAESDSVDKHPLADFLAFNPFVAPLKNLNKNNSPKFDAADSAISTLKGIKALSELCSEESMCQNKIVDFGVLCLLRRFLLCDDYEKLAANETYDASSLDPNDPSSVRVPPTSHIRRHAARLLNILSLLPNVKKAIIADEKWCKWLEDCTSGRLPCCNDLKIQSYCRSTLLNVRCSENGVNHTCFNMATENGKRIPQYEDRLFLLNPQSPHWACFDKNDLDVSSSSSGAKSIEIDTSDTSSSSHDTVVHEPAAPLFDVVFVHGLRGGPFNSWRIADNKSSTTSKAGFVENIDQEAGLQGTCWPREWLSSDFPCARLFTVKYKTNLTQWTGASLPLQEVSSMLLRKLVAAGVGSRPVVFVTHSMGGLVVKQMLYQAKLNNFDKFYQNTVGIVFYSCPHFGSKLADMPWHMGLVFRPAPSIGELRSGSPRLVELNDFIRHLHNKGLLDVLSFSETQVTPIVEGYGGWAFRLEIVPIESAYPGYGELVVSNATDDVTGIECYRSCQLLQTS